MPYTVVITQRAALELDAIVDWWKLHRSEEQAVRWYDKILEAVADLAVMPEGFPLAEENGQFSLEIREMLFGVGRRRTHRVIFTITGERIHVVAVRHTAQDRLTGGDLP
jgi:plasmid stabilization system protein ParE